MMWMGGLYSLRELKNEIHLMTNEEFGYFNLC